MNGVVINANAIDECPDGFRDFEPPCVASGLEFANLRFELGDSRCAACASPRAITGKQKTRYTIELPPQAVEVLRWHVRTQLSTPEQRDSVLLFPSVKGSFRTPTVLNKPFAAVSEAIGLGYAFTQRGMRRTFNDLMRAAEVEAIVTRSISGHLTERMQDHYSTVSAAEQRSSIAKVIALMAPGGSADRRDHAAA